MARQEALYYTRMAKILHDLVNLEKNLNIKNFLFTNKKCGKSSHWVNQGQVLIVTHRVDIKSEWAHLVVAPEVQ